MSEKLLTQLNSIDSKIRDNVSQSIMADIADNNRSRDLKLSVSQSDIYSATQNLGYQFTSRENIEAWGKKLQKRVKPTIETTEILRQIVDEINAEQEKLYKQNLKQQMKALDLSQTQNPTFFIDKNNNYYRYDNQRFVLEPSVVNIDRDGNYTVKTFVEKNSKDYLLATYDINHNPISFKITDCNNMAYTSLKYVAKKLDMKPEVVKPHKLHGYSGNCSGVTAVIKNFIDKPIPSGCYFDKSYNFFTWNKLNGSFDIQKRNGKIPGAPLISDYEFKEDIVIRTDYDGSGLYF